MESYIIELRPLSQPPSEDVRLVIAQDDAIHATDTDLRGHLTDCLKYVKNHQVYLVSGLFAYEQTLCLCLFAPDGRVLLRQPAIHLAPAFEGEYLRGDCTEVAHTELGNIFLCVDLDIRHPQVLRAAALKGADIIISVEVLDPAEDTESRLMHTAWNASQSNNVYVVNRAGGTAAVTCPAAVTRGGDGYIVRRTGTSPVRFGLNMERLDEIRNRFQLMEGINLALVRDYSEELRRQEP